MGQSQSLIPITKSSNATSLISPKNNLVGKGDDASNRREKFLDLKAPLTENSQDAFEKDEKFLQKFDTNMISNGNSIIDLIQHVQDLSASKSLGDTGSFEIKGSQAKYASQFEQKIHEFSNQLENKYQLILSERQNVEQKLQAAKKMSKSDLSKKPPPLPAPTQTCMNIGWEVLIFLLQQSIESSPEVYKTSLKMIKDQVCNSNPLTFADSVYLTPSASNALDGLCDFLSQLLVPEKNYTSSIQALSSSILADLALARGSLSHLLSAISWMLRQPNGEVEIGSAMKKLISIKEQLLYGVSDTCGELYTCGQNSYSELGLCDDIERQKLCRVSLAGWNVQQAAMGNEVLVVLTTTGVVLTCGLNKSGQCGHGHYDERVTLLRPVETLRPFKIRYVAANNGCEHVIAILEDGSVYSWGYNDRGQLGHGNTASKFHTPKLIEAFQGKNVVYASVSYHHSGVSTDAGELYMFGMNDCGQLGIDNTQHQYKPQLVTSLEGHHISRIACGLYHTIVCTSKGELFSFGKNDYGQLGLSHNKQTLTPTLVNISGEIASQVSCGYYHSCVITNGGKLYCFGRNDYGQLGIGSKVHQNFPQHCKNFPPDTRVTDVSSGCYHVIAISDQGNVFSFGRNNKGQLGNGSSVDSMVPLPIHLRGECTNRDISFIVAGFYTSAIIVDHEKGFDALSKTTDRNWMTRLCGHVDIDRSGEIEGLSNFGSICAIGTALLEGVWYYEVEVVTSGLIQVGWIDSYFRGSSDQGEGVGDHAHSWSYDGNRQRRWNSGSSAYGDRWKPGDIIGCLLDLNAGEMHFYRNGVSQGLAFKDIHVSRQDLKSYLIPAVSLERGEIIRVNLGHFPFKYSPDDSINFQSIAQTISSIPTTVKAKTISVEVPLNSTELMGSLEGSASVNIDGDIFVVGGKCHNSSESDNCPVVTAVWIFRANEMKWYRWSNLPSALQNHQVVYIGNNQILVIGGEVDSPASRHMDVWKCSSIVESDGSLPKWELVQGPKNSSVQLPPGRAFHSACFLHTRLDNIVFMFGGKSSQDEVLSDSWILSVDGFIWSKLPSHYSMEPGPRIGCSIAAFGEFVYMFGGQLTNGVYCSDLWRYNCFERVWQLVQDDDISMNTTDMLPSSRSDYGIAVDGDYVWIVGGKSKDDKRLNDIWVFSVELCCWTEVSYVSGSSLGLRSKCALLFNQGQINVTGCSDTSVVKYPVVFGGIVTNPSGKCASYRTDIVQLQFISEKLSDWNQGFRGVESCSSENFLGSYGYSISNFETNSDDYTISSADAGVCFLNELYRLSGGERKLNFSEEVQLSHCQYKQLCLNPKKSTFIVLHELIKQQSSFFFDQEALNTISTSKIIPKTYLSKIFSLLVGLHLLKLQFFELARSKLDITEAGFSFEDTLPGGALSSLQHYLFEIANHLPYPLQNPSNGNNSLYKYCMRIKIEAAEAIQSGFSALFPTLIDQVKAFSNLLKDDGTSPTSNPHSIKNMLIPILLPKFSDPSVLFSFITFLNDHENEINQDGSKEPSKKVETSMVEALQAFDMYVDVLLPALWRFTTDCIQDLKTIGLAKVIKKAKEFEILPEFQCFNVVHRMSLFWASKATEPDHVGWIFASRLCDKLMVKGVELLNLLKTCDCLSDVNFIQSFFGNSFIGKMLPLTVLSLCHLPSVSKSLRSFFSCIWPNMETIMELMSGLLQQILSKDSGDHFAMLPESPEITFDNFPKTSFKLSISVSRYLSNENKSSISWIELSKCLWTYLQEKDAHIEPYHVPHMFNSIYYSRLQLPQDFSLVLGQRHLIISHKVESVTLSDEFNPEVISFAPSLILFSHHIISWGTTVNGSLSSTTVNLPPPAPCKIVNDTPDHPYDEKNNNLDQPISYLFDDYIKILSFVGSKYASSQVIGNPLSEEEKTLTKWTNSPVFRGGLDSSYPENFETSYDQMETLKTSSIENKFEIDFEKNVGNERNNLLLAQILKNVDFGKQLLDKVRIAADPNARATANSKLHSRLRRQDSVDQTLEKSGGFEAVDSAVRATFAVLLKHSNVSYGADPLNEDGSLAEAVVDAWKTALQLRRWIVRQQQQLATASRSDEIQGSEQMKMRQQALYEKVCDPIVERARFLLQLAPVPLPSHQTSPFKLLPGLSTARIASHYGMKNNSESEEEKKYTHADAEQSVHQLKKLMENKSMKMIEEEDERIQMDIFSFLQQPLVEDDKKNQLLDSMKRILTLQRERALQRIEGFQVFMTILKFSSISGLCREHIIPLISEAFSRLDVSDAPSGEGEVVLDNKQTNAYKEVRTTRVHFMDGLEVVGESLSKKVSDGFFVLARYLLETSSEFFGGKIGGKGNNCNSITRQVHDLLMVLNVCALPYHEKDWKKVEEIGITSFLTKNFNWSNWKDLIIAEEDTEFGGVTDGFSTNVVLSLQQTSISNVGHFCGFRVAMDNQNICSTKDQSSSHYESKFSSLLEKGGLIVLNRPLAVGSWYWEVEINAQGSYPIFIGLSSSSVELNSITGKGLCGLYVLSQVDQEIPNSISLFLPDVRKIGVLLNWDKKNICFYNGKHCLQTIRLPTQVSDMGVAYPAIGLVDAKLQWDLESKPFASLRFLPPGDRENLPENNSSSGIIPLPLTNTAISWDGKARHNNIKVELDGLTITSGADKSPYSTIRTNRSFKEGKIFFEVRSLGSSDHIPSVKFGVVPESWTSWNRDVPSSIGFASVFDDYMNPRDQIIGILIDFSDGKITRFQHRCSPLTVYFENDGFSFYIVASFSKSNETIQTNFHPQHRPDIPSDAFLPQMACTRNCDFSDKVYGNHVSMNVVSYDGGEFSSSYGVKNCLLDDDTVFSTSLPSNVNLLLRNEADTPFCLTHITIRGPGAGYTAPLQHAILFAFSETPNLNEFESYNDYKPSDFVKIPCAPDGSFIQRDPMLPIMFITLSSCNAKVQKKLTQPIFCRYILIKFISSISGSNIDVGYIGISGFQDLKQGPAYSEYVSDSIRCSSCMHFPIKGIMYDLLEQDKSIGKTSDNALCCKCYDENRGDLNLSYTAINGVNNSSIKCPPRKESMEQILGFECWTKSSCKANNTNTKTKSDEVNEKAFKNAELYACGQNNYGELCLGHCNSTSKLETVSMFSGKNIKQIAGGNELLAVLTKNGVIYSCGLNKSGQCGQGNFEERIVLAQPVKFLTNVQIRMIATSNGCEHILAISDDGKCYSWGYNDRGQLGHGTTVSKTHTPKVIEAIVDKHFIVSAAASYHHSLIVSDKGECLTFGMNENGQLGLDHLQNQTTPQVIESLKGNFITSAACGLYHSVVVTSTGGIWSFGKNDYGQLGLGHTKDVKIPTLVSDTNEIKQVACGYYHTVSYSGNGKCLTFGRNDYGQLGIGNKTHQNTPTVVPLPATTTVSGIACGCYHTILLSEQGRVLAFGRNNKGQLGAGSRQLSCAELPMPIPPNRLGNESAVIVAAGFYSSYVLTGHLDQNNEAQNEAMTEEATGNLDRDTMYQSIMREIDVKHSQFIVQENKMYVKRSLPSRKQFQLLKLQTGVWALIRLLMYQSLHDIKKKGDSNTFSLSKNPVISTLIASLLDSFKDACDCDDDDFFSEDEVKSFGDGDGLSLMEASVGLLKHFGSTALPTLDSDLESKKKSTHVLRRLFRNQILWVLFVCANDNTEVCRLIASKPSILSYLIRGILQKDLSYAIVSIRLAMVVFPLHSVISVNKVLKEIVPTSEPMGDDIIQFILHMIGRSIVSWPKLCKHETSTLTASLLCCQSRKCAKGIPWNSTAGINGKHGEIMYTNYVDAAKSSESIYMLRYLSLYPVWKKAINAAITRSLYIAENCQSLFVSLDSLLDRRERGSSTPEMENVPDVKELTKSEKVDNNPKSTSDPKSSVLKFSAREQEESKKIESIVIQLSMLNAVISLIGGHVEALREGGSVWINDGDQLDNKRKGLITKLLSSKNGVELEVVGLDTWGSYDFCNGIISQRYNLSAIEPADMIDSMPCMFDNAIESLPLVANLIASTIEDSSSGHHRFVYQASSTTKVLKFLKEELCWKSMKALEVLLSQTPKLESGQVYSSLVANLATSVSLENSHILDQVNNLLSPLENVDRVLSLEKRWNSLKHRRFHLDVEEALNMALDIVETDVRDEVIAKMSNEGTFSWLGEIIQSPTCVKKSLLDNRSLLNGVNGSETITSTTSPDVWGILRQTKQSTETGQLNATFDEVIIELKKAVICVGRSIDSCDVVVNDRSVSGRHFHIRRCIGTERGEIYYELQDFSKNGTVVDGVRIHGTCTRIASGTRISLVLSRCGLITYEFRVMGNRIPGALPARLPAGPGSAEQQDQVDIVEPFSPAESQNFSQRTETRNRLGLQHLRLSNMNESVVPPLMSPNPAVDSPRVGLNFPQMGSGFHSPRTPTLNSSIVGSITTGVLSPASFQQRESSTSEGFGAAADEALRIAMSRHRSLEKTGPINDSIGSSTDHDIVDQVLFPNDSTSKNISPATLELYQKAITSFEQQVQMEWCDQALRACNYNEDESIQWIKDHLETLQAGTVSSRRKQAAHHLSLILNRPMNECYEVLCQHGDNVDLAIESILLSSNGNLCKKMNEDENDMSNETMNQSLMGGDLLLGIFAADARENPSYALVEDYPSSSQESNNHLQPHGSFKRVDGENPSHLSWVNLSDYSVSEVLSMNLLDLEEQQKVFSEALKAFYARKLLIHMIRLHLAMDGEEIDQELHSVFSAFSNRATLQRLVLFDEAPQNLSLDSVKNHKEILHSRLSGQMVKCASEQTLQKNMQSLQNLSLLSNAFHSTTKENSIKIYNFIAQFMLNERNKLSENDSLSWNKQIQNHILIELILQISSRIFQSHLSKQINDTMPAETFVKGPILLSSGIEVMVTNNYRRVWSIPSPDPIRTFRHNWRKRESQRKHKVNLLEENPVNLWRPTIPSDGLNQWSDQWYSLGDIGRIGQDAPTNPVLLVRDDGSGLLMPPVAFERVDVSGKTLQKDENQSKTYAKKEATRSIWWPIPPIGYVALGCVAGEKDKPDQAPELSSYRCIRCDLVEYSANANCIWKTSPGIISSSNSVKMDKTDTKKNRNQKAEANRVFQFDYQRISLWDVNSNFCRCLVPSLTLAEDVGISKSSCCNLKLSQGDEIFCSPVGIPAILRFVNLLVTLSDDSNKQITLRSEITYSLFALMKHELESQNCDDNVVALVRCLSSLINKGCKWEDHDGVLYIRSWVMRLYKEQEDGLMLSSLLQAMVELLLSIDKQTKIEQYEVYKNIHIEKISVLPYEYGFVGSPILSNSPNFKRGTKVKLSEIMTDARAFRVQYTGNEVSKDESQDLLQSLSISSIQFNDEPIEIHYPESVKSIAQIIYYEVCIDYVQPINGDGKPLGLVFGFGDEKTPLDGKAVGAVKNSYSFSPIDGQIHTQSKNVDIWKWDQHHTANNDINNLVKEIYGVGLSLKTKEIFFTRNGQYLGTAFSSVKNCKLLRPMISLDCSCQLLINLGDYTQKPTSFNHFSYKFNFGTIEWDDLFREFQWFSSLTDVYGVLSSLIVEKKGEALNKNRRLPDEFLLSADTFLSSISIDECLTIESAHPYDADLEEGTVFIPLATSMRIKLDQASETLNAHCLQILQGQTEGNENSESDVRCFTGACGSQEVTINGNCFTWRFPVQSNFQCRIDRSRKGPYIKLDNRETRMSLTRDKGWQSAIGVARFDGGIHSWEVKIISVTSSANIFLGVVKRDARLDSYLGKDNRGWGWIGNRALWHNGSKQRGTYGEKFNTGDVVRLTLDLKKGTLSYALNGKDLGVAFGPGGVGPKLEAPLYPGFALYNQRDSIELAGGHRIEDSGEDGIVGSNEEDLAGSEDESDVEDIPAHRLELACEISVLGFPIDWCVYALKHCDDDSTRAADFILNNIADLDSMVREEAEENSRRLKMREDRPSFDSDVASLPPSIDVIPPAPVVLKDEKVDENEGSGSLSKWGIAFTVIPEFTPSGRRLLASKMAAKLEEIHIVQCQFSLEQDEAIVLIVDETCGDQLSGSAGADPLRLSSADFKPTSDDLTKYPCLANLTLEQLQSRFLVLRNFNSRLQRAIPFIDFSSTDESSILCRGIRQLRGVIFRTVKLAWWGGVLREQQTPPTSRPDIEIDRTKASEAFQNPSKDKYMDTVFSQCFKQLSQIQPALLRGIERAFKCQFLGEFGDDFGGLYRECLAQMSAELHSKALPLFIPCPNAVHDVGENRELYIPKIKTKTDSKSTKMFEFVGKVMGMAIRTKNPLDLSLPAIIWKPLVKQNLERMDIESVHHNCFQVVDTIHNIKKHGVTPSMFDDLIDANFTVLGSDGVEVELIPGGRNVRVTWNDKEEYARAVESYRLAEFQTICSDIIRGLATIVPSATLTLFTWDELRTLVCGKPTVDIELLKRRTIYGDGCSATDPHIQYFWTALEEFSDEQRSLFLRFVWGRSRLPPTASDFTQDFKISGMAKSAANPDAYLPIAHTCFFSIDLPFYSSSQIMKEKLLYAITHCQAIDADNTTMAQRAGQGANWTGSEMRLPIIGNI